MLSERLPTKPCLRILIIPLIKKLYLFSWAVLFFPFSNFMFLISRGFLRHFVVKTIGIRKRRFDRSTAIIKQSEDKIYIGTVLIL